MVFQCRVLCLDVAEYTRDFFEKTQGFDLANSEKRSQSNEPITYKVGASSRRYVSEGKPVFIKIAKECGGNFFDQCEIIVRELR